MSDDALEQQGRPIQSTTEGPPGTILNVIRVPINAVGDIVTARQRGRELALKLGFPHTDATLIATAISELTRNIVLYAKRGHLTLAAIRNDRHTGIHIIAHDDGPGIPDLQRALVGGYSTSGGLGLGLSGVKRLVDEFIVDTEPGAGTRVAVTKWLQ
jgi:serine/threonine-protein kinase RsbT